MNKIYIYLIALLVTTSCTDDLFKDKTENNETKEVIAHLTYNLAPMKGSDGKSINTRSITPSTVNETGINNLWVIQYDSNGAFLKKSYITNVKTSTFEAPLVTSNTNLASNIHFIANVGTSLLGDISTETKLKAVVKDITAESDLLYTGSDNKKYIPMYGTLTGIIVPINGYLESSNISLVRLLSRIDITFSGSITNVTISGIRACNVTKKMQLIPPATATTTATTTYDVFNFNAETTGTVLGTTYTFYLPENQRGKGTNVGTDPKLKGGITNATFIELSGSIDDTTGPRSVTFTVYPGTDNYNDYNLIRNTYYTYTATLSSLSTTDTRVKPEELANCYMLKPGATISIPYTQSNLTPAGTVFTSNYYYLKVLWQTSVGLITVVPDPAKPKFIKITAPSSSVEGNAIVAINIYDGIGLPTNTYHIWVTNYDPNNGGTVHNVNGYTWMDRNLGATTVTPATITSYGLCYQWGRKDPFPMSSTTTSTTNATVYDASGAVTAITTRYPKSSYTNPYAASFTESYTYFAVSASEPPYDWYFGVSNVMRNDNLWAVSGAETKTNNDPCPVGWRVPIKRGTTDVFAAHASGGTWTANNGMTWSAAGVYIPAAGYRYYNTSDLSQVGTGAYLWTGNASPTTGYSTALKCSSTGAAISTDMRRADGLPVRCVKVQ